MTTWIAYRHREGTYDEGTLLGPVTAPTWGDGIAAAETLWPVRQGTWIELRASRDRSDKGGQHKRREE